MVFSILVMIIPILVLGGAAWIGWAFFRRLSGPTADELSGPFHEKLLYEIDRLRVQMQITNERLERLEAGYLGPPRGREEGRDESS